nr:LysE family translocator [Burkholderia ubonensis]
MRIRPVFAASRASRAAVLVATHACSVCKQTLATLGLGALLQASEWLFTVLKLAGALYLLYLGVTLLRSPAELTLSSGGRAQESALRTFAQGALSNVSNPKVALFYLAFLPQFVQADAARPMLSVFVLGATFAGLLSTSIRRNPRILTRMHRISGVVLLGLGVKLALERR